MRSRFGQDRVERIAQRAATEAARPQGSFRGRLTAEFVQPLERRFLLSAAVKTIHPVTSIAAIKGSAFHFPVAFNKAPQSKLKRSLGGVVSAVTGLSTPFGGITPQQMRSAYGVSSLNFNGIAGDGSGETIAILDPGDDTGLVNSTSPSFATSDLAQFDAYYGLPNPPSFIKDGFTDPASGTPQLTSTLPAAGTGNEDSDGEISLDVEWAHVMAPQANILLVEGSPDFSDIFNGVLAVNAAPTSMHICALSMSFDGAENGTLSSTANAEGVDGAYFDNAGLVYVAATGDYGAYSAGTKTITPQFPASSSNVLAVGGTTLSVNGNNYVGETTWGTGTNSGTDNGSGGGLSVFEPQPAYQVGKVNGITTSARAYPDISLEGNDSPGVPIYDSPDYGTGTGWVPGTYGGTSLASPMMAGLIADADQGRALDGLSALSSSGGSGIAASNPNGNPSSLDVHTLLYKLGYSNSDFHDITTGSSNGPASYGPRTGYDLSSGLGSPVANNLVVDLSGISSIPANNLPAITNLYIKESSPTQIAVWVNSATPGSGTPTATYLLGYASGINYTGGAGSDTLTLDYSNGNFAASFTNEVPVTTTANPSPSAPPVNYVGTGGNNTLAIVGTAASDTLTATASTLTPSGGLGTSVIGISNVQTLQFLGGSGGSDALNVTGSPAGGYTVNADTASGTPNIAVSVTNSGTLVNFAATQHLASLNIGDGAAVTVVSSASSGGKVLVTSGLTIAPTGRLDLTNNAMVVNYLPGSDPLSTIAMEVAAGYNGGGTSAWTGNGITSSSANTNRFGVGYGEASTDLGSSGGIFLGQTVGANAILVRFTLDGDVNLDGTVNAADLGVLLNNYNGNSKNWTGGDFNYDGTVDATDLGLMLNTFNQSDP